MRGRQDIGVGEKFASARYHDTKRQLRTRFAYILFQLVQYLDSQIIKVAIVHEAFEHLIGGHCWSQSCGTGITTRLLHLSQYFLKPLFAASFAFFAPFPPASCWWWIRTPLKTPYKKKTLNWRLKIVCRRESVHGYQPKADCLKPQRIIWKSSSEIQRYSKRARLWAWKEEENIVRFGSWASSSSLHHPTLIENPNSSSSSLQLNSSHIKIIREVTFFFTPYPLCFHPFIPSFSGIRKVRKFY